MRPISTYMEYMKPLNPPAKSSSVTQDNQLIESCYTMSLNEKRLLMLGMSRVNPMKVTTGGEPLKFKIKAEDWSDNFPDKDSPYRAMKRAADSLMGRYVTLHPKTGVTKKIAWFDSVEYHDHEASVSVRFGWSIQERLVGMLENFTKVDLLAVNKLKSLYAVRLYELIRQFWPKKERELSGGYRIISIEDFRIAMDCMETYRETKQLKQWVIKPAVKELNTRSDLRVECEDVKRGRKITHFKFVFKEENQQDLFAGRESSK